MVPTDYREFFESAPVVPIVQSSNPEEAVATARALMAGGLPAVEVVLRTERSLECLRSVADEVPEMIVGAGTVLNAAQAIDALQAGARFIVSPGLDDGVIETARDHEVPVFPGIMTATEAQRAFNLGLRVVKFFPSSVAGGVPAIKALASVFGELRFMPTGGITAANLSEFLALPQVLACGGSWLTPADSIAAGRYEDISRLAAEAIEIARQARA